MNKTELTAEFAIAVRKTAMRKGFSAYGIREIIRIGLEEIGLQKIYWCVAVINARAVKFYDKNGYKRTTDVPDSIAGAYTPEQLETFIWYVACE